MKFFFYKNVTNSSSSNVKRKIKVFCGTEIFMRMSSYKTVKFEWIFFLLFFSLPSIVLIWLVLSYFHAVSLSSYKFASCLAIQWLLCFSSSIFLLLLLTKNGMRAAIAFRFQLQDKHRNTHTLTHKNSNNSSRASGSGSGSSSMMKECIQVNLTME